MLSKTVFKLRIFSCLLMFLNLNLCFPVQVSSMQANEPVFEPINLKNKKNTHAVGPAVLLMRFNKMENGVQHHVFSLYKGLLESGFNVHVAVTKGTNIQKKLEAAGLPHYSFACMYGTSDKIRFESYCSALNKICKNLNIKIIHVNGVMFEFRAAKEVAKQLNLKVVQQYHYYKVPGPSFYDGADGLISASPIVAQALDQKNKEKKLGLRIEFIPPLCDESRFVDFVSNLSREDFFYSNFGIKINKTPILCCVSNFYRCKNHEALLNAVHNLIFKQNIKVQLVLAGTGNKGRTDALKKMCENLKIEKYVYFLNFVQNIPELLFHSDIKILPSSGDAFGIVIMEAALMKKPIILSKNAGSAGIIVKHGQTGLICDPDNVENITEQIKKMVQNPDFAKKLGENAFNCVVNDFSSKNIVLQYVDFYNKLLKAC